MTNCMVKILLGTLKKKIKILIFVVLLAYELVLGFYAKRTLKTQNFEKKKLKMHFVIWSTLTVDTMAAFFLVDGRQLFSSRPAES